MAQTKTKAKTQAKAQAKSKARSQAKARSKAPSNAIDIAYQEHSKFKVFVGMLTKSRSIGVLANKVARFADEQKIAAKSIGVEYLESSGQLLVTLGYREDEPYYPIQLHCTRLGKLDVLGGDYAALEQAMEQTAQKHSNVICHELYATDDHELLMIVMTHA